MLRGGLWHLRRANWLDLAALILIVAIILLLGSGARQMLAPFVAAQAPQISLSPEVLPNYALRTTMRMLAALLASLTFTFIYGTLAAKSRRAELILIPLLDILQSVPVLGYLSFTVVFFISLFPGRMLGPELAAIFAIFTSQAWNMAFSFYQSLTHHSARSRRSEPRLSLLRLAALLARSKSRSPCRAWSGTR